MDTESFAVISESGSDMNTRGVLTSMGEWIDRWAHWSGKGEDLEVVTRGDTDSTYMRCRE